MLLWWRYSSKGLTGEKDRLSNFTHVEHVKPQGNIKGPGCGGPPTQAFYYRIVFDLL